MLVMGLMFGCIINILRCVMYTISYRTYVFKYSNRDENVRTFVKLIFSNYIVMKFLTPVQISTIPVIKIRTY